MVDIYIRPLKESDANKSYIWRNNPIIWKYTDSKPDGIITKKIEKKWIKEKLTKTDEVRFAICLTKNDKYIGNVQLTNIKKDEAQFHIFIGDSDYWGRGIGSSATKLLVQYASNELKISKIYLVVNKKNNSAIRAYKKAGFKTESKCDNNLIMVFLNYRK